MTSKRRTTDLHGLGYKHSKVMTPSFDLHLILLKEVLRRQGRGRQEDSDTTECRGGEICDVFKDKTTDIERR